MAQGPLWIAAKPALSLMKLGIVCRDHTAQTEKKTPPLIVEGSEWELPDEVEAINVGVAGRIQIFALQTRVVRTVTVGAEH